MEHLVTHRARPEEAPRLYAEMAAGAGDWMGVVRLGLTAPRGRRGVAPSPRALEAGWQGWRGGLRRAQHLPLLAGPLGDGPAW